MPPTGPASPSSSALGPACIGLVVAALVGVAMWRSETPWTLTLDAGNSFLGQTVPAFRAWAAGRVPEWTDLIWGGFPAIAEPTTAALYPLHWIPFLATRDVPLRFFDVALALHLGLFAAGGAMLLRELGARTPVVVLAGILTALSPYWHWTSIACFTAFGAIAWFPWTLVAAEGLLRPETPLVGRRMVLGWVALAAQVLVGMPEQAVYSGSVAAVWLLFRRSPIGLGARLVRLALLATGALALAAPQALTTLAYLPVTTRARKTPAAEMGSLWLEGAHRMLVPGLGTMIAPAFLGITTLGVAAMALVRRRSAAAVLCAVALATFLLALGPQVGIYGWLRSIPPFSYFRVPIKLYGMTELAVVWAAALGVDVLSRHGYPARRRMAAVLAVLLVVERAAHVLLDEPAALRGLYATAPHAGMVDALAGVAPLRMARPHEAPPTMFDLAPPAGGHYAHSLGALAGISSLHPGDVSLLPRPHAALLYRPQGPASFTLLGVRYVLAPTRQCAGVRGRLPSWPQIVDTADFCLLENPSPMGTFSTVTAATAVDSRCSPPSPQTRRLPCRSSLPARSSPTSHAGACSPWPMRRATHAWSSARQAGPCSWVRQSFVPGWKARVDGVPATIHPAAGLYFAIPIEPGAHTVELEYRAPGLRVGGAIAAAWTLVALVWVAWRGWARRRRTAVVSVR